MGKNASLGSKGGAAVRRVGSPGDFAGSAAADVLGCTLAMSSGLIIQEHPIAMLTVLATLFLCLTIVVLVGTIVQQCKTLANAPSRVEEIRRLRQEGLAVNQEGET